MILFEKAKRLGVWNPSDLDFSQDREDWLRLAPEEQDLLLRLTSLFIAGEEAVTVDLLPLIAAVAHEGRLEEELYLTTFLWEEAKHVDFFSRFLTEVCGGEVDYARYQSASYSAIICEALPDALQALRTDTSPQALARASAVYNMVVEGMLAETGYHAYFTVMDKCGILPGQRQGIMKLKLDESRHIAYGVYLLSRLMAEDPGLWETVEATMTELLPVGLGVVQEVFSAYDPVPFGIDQDEFMAYAGSQFQKRFDRVRRARDMSLDELNRETEAIIDSDDA
jgi:ribonucleoside-diphosphate reductase beta chain